jgi:hypothetical protein
MLSTEPQFTIGNADFDTEIDEIPLDLLGRKASGERLSGLVERLTAPTVIALDGGWGSGKSHFLKLWCGAHRKDAKHKARPIYIDAFAEDYLDDPLISLVAAIDREITPEPDSATDKALGFVKRHAGKVIRSGARIGLAAASLGLTELAAPALDAAIEKATEDADKAIDNLWKAEANRTKALQDFRKALADLAAETPLVLIVDELDRCRPDYALSLLEIAKHSFAVPGVHFILGVNLASLEHSVRKRYGAGIDAAEYLQKFYHLRMGLPEDERPTHKNWRPIFDAHCKQLSLPTTISTELVEYLEHASQNKAVSLRDVQRIVNRAALLPTHDPNRNAGRTAICLCAIILETLHPQIYSVLRNGTVNRHQIETVFSISQFPTGNNVGAPWLWHVWSFLLDELPSDETREMMRGAFSIRGGTPNLRRILREDLDLFTLPTS